MTENNIDQNSSKSLRPELVKSLSLSMKQCILGVGFGFSLGVLSKVVRLKPNALSTGFSSGMIWGLGGLIFFPQKNFISRKYAKKLEVQGFSATTVNDTAALYSSLVSGASTGGLMSFIYLYIIYLNQHGTLALTFKSIVNRSKVFPLMILSCLGAGGLQAAYTFLVRYRQALIIEEHFAEKLPFVPTDRTTFIIDKIVANLPAWIPITKVSDEDFLAILEEKIYMLKQDLIESEVMLKTTITELNEEIRNRPTPNKAKN